MKRVIEIDKDMFNVLRNAEDMDCEVSAEAHIINQSKSLNEVLNRIINEINSRRKYMAFTTCRDCIDIIEAYKESEDK